MPSTAPHGVSSGPTTGARGRPSEAQGRNPNRPNVTEAELKLFYEACDAIRDIEPVLSVRGYAYRIGGMATYDEDGNVIDGIRLHGDICTKEPPAPGEDPINTESIQRYILKGRRIGRLSYDAIIDNTRPTTSGGGGWTSRASAISYADNARKNMIADYSLDIWTLQKKFVEVLSEKLALEPIVKRPCERWEVDLSTCKGFSSESLLYRKRLQLLQLRDNLRPHLLRDNSTHRLTDLAQLDPQFEDVGAALTPVESSEIARTI